MTISISEANTKVDLRIVDNQILLYRSEYGDLDGPFSRAVVVVDGDNLLPGAELNPVVSNRYGNGGPEQCGLNMTVTVSVVPGLFVFVRSTLWRQ